MALKYSKLMRKVLSEIPTPSVVLSLYTGSKPSSILAAPTGTLLADIGTMTFSVDDDVNGGVEIPSPVSAFAIAAGTPGYWRLWSSIGKTTCYAQGSIGSGLSAGAIAAIGQKVVLSSFAFRAGNFTGNSGSDVQYSESILNSKVDQIDYGPGSSGAACVFTFFTGAAPTNVEDAYTGTVIGELNVTNWLSAADNGVALLGGTPLEFDAIANGTIGYFRMSRSGSLDFAQGTVGVVGSGADIEMPSATVIIGQTVKINQFTVSGASML